MVVRSIDDVGGNTDVNWDDYSDVLASGIWSDFRTFTNAISDPANSEFLLERYLTDLESKTDQEWLNWMLFEDMVSGYVTQFDGLTAIIGGITTGAVAFAGAAVAGLAGGAISIVGGMLAVSGLVNRALGAGIGEVADTGIFDIPGIVDLTPLVAGAGGAIEGFGDFQVDSGAVLVRTGMTAMTDIAPQLAALSLYSLYNIPGEVKESMDDQQKFDLLLAQSLDELMTGTPIDEVRANHSERYEESGIGVQFVPNMGDAVAAASIYTGISGATVGGASLAVVSTALDAYFGEDGRTVKDTEDISDDDVNAFISASEALLNERNDEMIGTYGQELVMSTTTEVISELSEPNALQEVIDTVVEANNSSDLAVSTAGMNQAATAVVAALKQQLKDNPSANIVLSTPYGSVEMNEWFAEDRGLDWPLSDEELLAWVSTALTDYGAFRSQTVNVDAGGNVTLEDGSTVELRTWDDNWGMDNEDSLSSPTPPTSEVPRPAINLDTYTQSWLNHYTTPFDNAERDGSAAIGYSEEWAGATYTITGLNEDGRVQNWKMEIPGEEGHVSFFVEYTPFFEETDTGSISGTTLNNQVMTTGNPDEGVES